MMAKITKISGALSAECNLGADTVDKVIIVI
jgi:hypothetical protein